MNSEITSRKSILNLQFHHVGIGTEDFDGAIESYLCLAHSLLALAFDNQPVAFFFNRSIGLIELVERPPSHLAPFA
jgi:hypothetical protein